MSRTVCLQFIDAFRRNAFRTLLCNMLLSLLLLFQLILPSAALAAKPLQIRDVSLDTGTSLITFLANQPFTATKYFTLLKLPNPDRVVIDLPNASLATASPIITVNRNGIREIEFSESKGPYYNAVRMTVYLTNRELLNQANASIEGHKLLLSLQAPPISTPPVNTLMTDESKAGPLNTDPALSVIQDIYFRDDQLILRAKSKQSIQLKQRFTLKDPNRLVVDLDQSTLASKSLLRPIVVHGTNIQVIRIGQFEKDTVRLVIEATHPERIQLVYPGPDKSLAALTTSTETSIATLPSTVPLTEVDKVTLRKEGDSTIIRVSSNGKMLHRLIRDNDKLLLELSNVAASAGNIPFDRDSYPVLEQLAFEPLTAGQPNSKLVINLAASDVEFSGSSSADGKAFDLTLTPWDTSTGGSYSSGGPFTRSPYRARVVIDAGHGGKDMGANRNGIMEKDLNLSVALKLKRALESRGIKVYMTRATDLFLPLPEITRITNSLHPDLFVSVHTNSSENPSITGLETYYFTPQSVPLARQVHRKLVNTISSPDRGVRQARFYVIHHTPVPAILCEMGYISNSSERSQLVSEWRKQRTADAIAEGVVEYLKTTLSAQAKR